MSKASASKTGTVLPAPNRDVVELMQRLWSAVYQIADQEPHQVVSEAVTRMAVEIVAKCAPPEHLTYELTTASAIFASRAKEILDER